MMVHYEYFGPFGIWRSYLNYIIGNDSTIQVYVPPEVVWPSVSVDPCSSTSCSALFVVSILNFFPFPLQIVSSTASTSIVSSSLNYQRWRQPGIPKVISDSFSLCAARIENNLLLKLGDLEYGSHKFTVCLSAHGLEETVGHSSAAQLPIDQLLACDSVRSQRLLCSRYPSSSWGVFPCIFGNQRAFLCAWLPYGYLFSLLHPDIYNAQRVVLEVLESVYFGFQFLALPRYVAHVLLVSTLFQGYASILAGLHQWDSLVTYVAAMLTKKKGRNLGRLTQENGRSRLWHRYCEYCLWLVALIEADT